MPGPMPLSAALALMLASSPPALPGPNPIERTARLHYVGHESCPDEARLRQLVIARLGYDPFRPDAELTIDASIERELGLRALIALSRAGQSIGQRALTHPGPDCEPLMHAVALAISLSIDPLAQVRPKPAAPEPPPAPVASTPAPMPPESAGLSTHIGAGMGAAISALPAPSWGPTGSVRLAGERFSVGLDGRIDLPVTTAAGGGRVETSLATGALVFCTREGGLSGCVLGQGGAFQSTGRELAEVRRPTQPYAALGLRAQAEWPPGGNYAVRLQADLLAPLVRPVLLVDGAEVWNAPAVSAGLGFLVVRNFW